MKRFLRSVILILSIVLIFFIHHILFLSQYLECISPSGQYVLRVYKIKPFLSCIFFCLPGGGGDYPGYIVLKDVVQNKTLYRGKIQMCNMVNKRNITWGISGVDFTGAYDGITYKGEKFGCW